MATNNDRVPAVRRRVVRMPNPVVRGGQGKHNVNWYRSEQEAQDAVIVLTSCGQEASRAPELDRDGLFAVLS